MSSRSKPFRSAAGPVLALAVVLPALTGAPAAAGPPSAPYWSVAVSTAPHLPQDVWFAGTGNNEDGWFSGGSICLNQLAQGFPKGEQLTALVDIVEGGIYGVDGTPVPPGTYTFPGITEPDFDYTVTSEITFYVILDTYVVFSRLPELPEGTRLRSLWMWDYEDGRNDVHVVQWIDFGFGFVPSLNEGVMMANTRLHP
ncbi:MAG TPA: hypothetical protein VIL46_10700 [Gemmataceae bacterium]